ncbi:MAG TPA: hypothetical protein VFW16_10245 [Streptosporangiaceae bacterium]|nr:hypothetical protein [Streptosporangiaceae bacterium]
MNSIGRPILVGGRVEMGGRADRLADVPSERADGAHEGRARHREAGVLGELLRRQAALPPGHPSAPPDKSKRAREAEPSVRPDLDGQSNLADAGERGFWSKVRRFEELWQAHLARWPDKQDKGAKPDRRDDPAGSWRGAGDRYLNPNENAEADKQVDLLHGPEKAVTKLLMQIEHENPYGAVLVGLEHRHKGVDRIKEKIADKMRFKDVNNAADAARTINDAVRYTFCLRADEYVAGHAYVSRQLEAAGYRKAYGRNHWLDDPNYKGVNTRWVTADGGRFELQFHTRESFYAKEHLTHAPYKRLRGLTASRAEQRELIAFQREVSAAVPRPHDVSQIPNYNVRLKDG